MNLRRIVKGIVAMCLVVFGATQASAQSAQLAGISQDGLLQLGSNHPFVVSTYEIDLSQFGFTTQQEAADLFRKYIEEGGFDFTFDMADEKAILTLDLQEWSQFTGNAIEVAAMNDKLRAVHRIRR